MGSHGGISFSFESFGCRQERRRYKGGNKSQEKERKNFSFWHSFVDTRAHNWLWQLEKVESGRIAHNVTDSIYPSVKFRWWGSFVVEGMVHTDRRDDDDVTPVQSEDAFVVLHFLPFPLLATTCSERQQQQQQQQQQQGEERDGIIAFARPSVGVVVSAVLV